MSEVPLCSTKDASPARLDFASCGGRVQDLGGRQYFAGFGG